MLNRSVQSNLFQAEPFFLCCLQYSHMWARLLNVNRHEEYLKNYYSSCNNLNFRIFFTIPSLVYMNSSSSSSEPPLPSDSPCICCDVPCIRRQGAGRQAGRIQAEQSLQPRCAYRAWRTWQGRAGDHPTINSSGTQQQGSSRGLTSVVARVP